MMTVATRLRAAGQAPPYKLAGLEVWLEARFISGLADGAAVTTWPDASGNAHDVTQGGGASTTYETGIFNGLPAVRFAGPTYMTTAAFTINQPFTMITVVQASSAAGGPRIIASGAGSTTIFVSGGALSLYAGSVLGSGTAYDTSPRVLTAVFNGGSSVLRRDGTQIAAGAAGADAMATLRLGADGLGSNNYAGDMGAAGIYSRVLTGGEITQVERFLGGAYGITVA
jgi:hypothetical protein